MNYSGRAGQRGQTKAQDDLPVTCLLGSIKTWTERHVATNTRRLYSVPEELLIPCVVHGRARSVGQRDDCVVGEHRPVNHVQILARTFGIGEEWTLFRFLKAASVPMSRAHSPLMSSVSSSHINPNYCFIHNVTREDSGKEVWTEKNFFIFFAYAAMKRDGKRCRGNATLCREIDAWIPTPSILSGTLCIGSL